MTKKTFIIVSIFLLSCIVFTGIAGLAAQTEKNDAVIKARTDTILSDYFQYREESIFKAHEARNTTGDVSLETTTNFNTLSTNMLSLEQSRANGIREYLDNCGLILIDSETFFGIKDYKVESNLIHITVYEAISMVWMFESVKQPFESAIGIEHEIYIDPNSMTIVADEYDEKLLSGISTSKENI